MTARVESTAGAVPTTPAAASVGVRFADVLRRTLAAVDSTTAAPPPPSDARTAIELQASVYEQTERIELASRLLDHAVGSVKTILQTRV